MSDPPRNGAVGPSRATTFRELTYARVVSGSRRLYNGVQGGPLDDLVLCVTDPL
jgi:hypothetical protein